MNRRDTIIIAVLLNAGLLIVLFATSLKSDTTPLQPSTLAVESPTPKVEEGVAVKAPEVLPTSISGTDEVDQMVKQYIPPIVDNKPNFAADLQAIGSQPEGPSSLPPALDPAAAALAGVSFEEVKVKKGDVLERIARNHRVSVDELMKANHLSTTRLKIGQVLKIPVKDGTKIQHTPLSSSVEEGAAKYYVVKVGDNPWTIAVKNHIKVEELLNLNHLDEEKARRLKPGDKIRIK